MLKNELKNKCKRKERGKSIALVYRKKNQRGKNEGKVEATTKRGRIRSQNPRNRSVYSCVCMYIYIYVTEHQNIMVQ